MAEQTLFDCIGTVKQKWDFGDQLVIPLTKGKFTTIDAADAYLISGIKFHASVSLRANGNRWYAQARLRVSKTKVQMHRMILGVDSSTDVDHRDGDTLNNRRCNLRPANKQQNAANKSIFHKGESGFRGVKRNHKKWLARISVFDREIYLGTFNTPEEAAKARDVAALKYYGEFAHLNFPQ